MIPKKGQVEKKVSAARRKRNKQPTQYNPKGVRVMILREGKIKWGWQ